MDVSNTKFVQMGGTLDKTYLTTANHHGLNFEIGEPAFIPMLERMGVSRADMDYSKVCIKDSLHISDVDRNTLLTKLAATPKPICIITHGTDTIEKTAQYIADTHHGGKVIVFTGAMLPFMFLDSDALFQFGYALGSAHNLSNGVYVALNGITQQF